jgi:general nucleoside transport system permease protein
MFDQIFDASFVDAVVRAVVPILLAGLGGVLAERAGVFQISLEGSMVVGAFAAVAASYWTSSALIGVLAGGLFGASVAAVLAYGVVSRDAEPIVLGVALNLFAFGMTGFLLFQLFEVRGTFNSPEIVGLGDITIPWLSDIPVVGEALFVMSPLGYLAFLMVPLSWFLLFRTTVGLRLRGVGEDPSAARSLGVNVERFKYVAVIASGFFAGLGGVQLSLSNVRFFTEGMSAGRGWIAIVAIMLGRAHPVWVLGAVVLFGSTEALGFRLQGSGLPSQATEAMPFAITIVALVLARKRFAKLLNLSVNIETQ